jgi:hypothetical protein
MTVNRYSFKLGYGLSEISSGFELNAIVLPTSAMHQVA